MMPLRPFRRRRAIAFTIALTAGLASIGSAPRNASAASAPTRDSSNAPPGGYGWFEGGYKWYGDFADPHMVLYNGKYYLYSSGAGGRYLGVQTSTDGSHWTIAPHWSDHSAPWLGGPNPLTDTTIPAEIRASNQSAGDIYNLNDALVRPAAWGLTIPYNAWYRKDYWAVGVAKIGTTWYSWAPVKISNQLGDGTWDPEGFGRYCLTVSTAKSPLGPFRDITGSKPYFCDADPGGSIDPSPYTDPTTGAHYLTWKAAGQRSRPGIAGYPSALRGVRIDSLGRMTGPITTLLTTAEGTWEGYTVENPAMIKYQGQWYLFYSANSFLPNRAGNSAYATGYAICKGPLGPCRRLVRHPLLKSTATESGPGGAHAFLDAVGKLRLVYASFTPGEYRTNHPIHQPRRMHQVRLTRRSDNVLVLT